MNNASTARRSIVSPEDQSATFVELFFDLVFVFSVTQIVGLLHDGFTWMAVGQAVLVFWLVWWAWTQFTWALNAADTTHHWINVGTLLATAVAFFMTIALPGAFGDQAFWFALAYTLVRLIGLVLYLWVSWQDPLQRRAVQTFSLVSLGGLAAVVVGGIVGGTAQYWLWGLAILLDLIAANSGANSEGWNLHPQHFGERHGLFVIIALGETLIVVGSGVAEAAWTANLLGIAVLAVGITCGFWWDYFRRVQPILEHTVASRRGIEQSTLARDVFSLLHFPMMLGVIAFAFAVEEIVVHPAEPLQLATRLALALGPALFVGGMVVAVWRVTGRIPWLRLALVAATVIMIVLLAGVAPLASLAVAFVGVASIILLERNAGSPSVALG